MDPKLNKSALRPYPFYLNTSGAMYVGVPHLSSNISSRFNFMASPKSAIFISKSTSPLFEDID